MRHNPIPRFMYLFQHTAIVCMKLKYSIIICLACSCFATVSAQKKKQFGQRSLYCLPATVKDSIDAINDLADTLCLHKKDEGYRLAATALQLSQKIKYHIGIGDASHSLGLTKFRRNNDSAVFYFEQALKEYKKEYPGFQKMAFTLNNLSRTYDEQLKFDSSMYYAQQALGFVQKNTAITAVKNKWLMYTYGAIANTYSSQSRYDSANNYYLKAIGLAEQSNNNKMLEVYFKGLSGIQSQLGNYEKAALYGRKAVAYIEDDCRALSIALANLGGIYSKLKDFANADKMADSSIKKGRQCNAWNSIGRNYSTLGNSQMEQKNYSAALQYFKTGMQQAQLHHNSKSSISGLYKRIGEAYESLDSLTLAKENYLSALKTAEGDNEILNGVYLSLSHLSFKEGDANNAYKYLKQYNAFRDTIYTNEKIKIITELNTLYETEKKDQQLLLFSKDKELQNALLLSQLQQIERSNAIKREQQLAIDNYRLETEKQEQLLQIQQLDIENSSIKQLEQQAQLASSKTTLEVEKKQKELNAATIKNQRNWFLFLSSVFIIAALIAAFLFNRYKLVKKLQSQQVLIEQRQRISRDLHDEVGATLSGIAMYSHLIKGQLQSNNIKGVQNSLQVMQQSSSQMVDKLNDIVWLINPEKDSLQQLINRLEDYAIKMAAVKGIKVNIKVPDIIADNILAAETRRNIYLFCKEAINNAVKYSNATTLDFSVAQTNSLLQIAVVDNGVGFDTMQSASGNGLSNMKKRAAAINGQIQLESGNGSGTIIKLSIKITP